MWMTALESCDLHRMRPSEADWGQRAVHRGDALRDIYSGSRPRCRSARIATLGVLLSPMRDHVRTDEPLEAGDASSWTGLVEWPTNRSPVDTFWTHKAPKLGVTGRNSK